MSKIEKAYELLKEELGDNFKFTSLQGFKEGITKPENKYQLLAYVVKNAFPDAEYLEVTLEYDSCNRINQLNSYSITNDMGVIETDDWLRENDFALHSQIHSLICDTIVEDEEVGDWEEEVYSFDLDELETEQI